jgi:hypothetical protein
MIYLLVHFGVYLACLVHEVVDCVEHFCLKVGKRIFANFINLVINKVCDCSWNKYKLSNLITGVITKYLTSLEGNSVTLYFSFISDCRGLYYLSDICYRSFNG